MKNLFRHIMVLIATLLAFSCSNDFLTEELDHASPEDASIIISPDWPAQDYSIYCPNVGNAKFKVTKAPAWLKISSTSGQFTNGFATLNCTANINDDFSEVGIYYTYMTLEVEGKGNRTILIAYITEGNPAVETNNPVNINFDYFGELSFKNTGNGILFFSILDLPKWLSLIGNGGRPVSIEEYPAIVLPQNGESFIPFLFNHNVPFAENLSGKIVIITNDKNRPIVEVEVKTDFGTPLLSIYSDHLDFGRIETIKEFGLANQGNGLLVWKIEGCPNWLTVSEYEGLLPYQNKFLTITCNRDQMPVGINTVTIYLKTNDKNMPSYPISVTAHNHSALTENVKPIEGNITNAYYDKQSDILYLTTTQPDRLLAYDTQNRTIARELSFNHAPTCFRLSEDGYNALIGHNGYITTIDMENFEVIKTIEVGQNVHDIEWANDDWCCYTLKNVQWSNLYWVNLKTNEISYTDRLYGGCVLYRIPDENYILVAEVGISSGVYLVDIDTKEIKNSFRNKIGNFWVSEDGTYIFTGDMSASYLGGHVFRTSSFLTPADNVPFFSRLSPQPYWIPWIDHHATSQSVWVLTPSDFLYSELRVIIQYDDNDYKRVNTYYFDDYHNSRLVQAHYVFANKAGTELVAIRNVTSGNFMWSLEFITIEEQ